MPLDSLVLFSAWLSEISECFKICHFHFMNLYVFSNIQNVLWPSISYGIKSGLFTLTPRSFTIWWDLSFPPFPNKKPLQQPHFHLVSLDLPPDLPLFWNIAVFQGQFYSFMKTSLNVSMWVLRQVTAPIEKKVPLAPVSSLLVTQQTKSASVVGNDIVKGLLSSLLLSFHGDLRTCPS